MAKDGLKGLWVGWGPNVMRNSIINAAEIASYDQYKEFTTQTLGFNPTAFYTHFFCAFGAGFNAVIVGSPVDVLKTRMMNATPDQPSNPLSLSARILTSEGPLAFYKGFTANFMRLGSWNVVMFVTLEQTKKYFDNKYAKA